MKENIEENIREIVQLRLGQTGDASRPLGWKKIANKCKTTLDAIRETRRSQEYYGYVKTICESIGMARLQAKACRKNRSLYAWLENAFGLDIYSARILADEIDKNPLPRTSESPVLLPESKIEELAKEADSLVVETTDTISLSRKHVKWLLKQGYSASDKMLLRASTMTRHVCARTEPDFLTQKS